MKPSTERKPEPLAVRFREYEARDFPSLCRLDQMCFPPAIAYDPEEIAAALVQPHTFCVVAEQDEQVVGFILLNYRRTVGHIITIDLHPDYRRRGLGSRFMKMAEQHLAELGVRRVVLEVATNNDAAIAFYRARGYSTQRILPHYYRDGTDAYMMEKVL
ncbi:MAG: ribosomal protein S18-alanine N-acetyltransferase [Acidobacteria bacterium]|nr:ribosomal protein S18-alanine N-acetyltransferase [Acidobacteriota bacterium]